MQIKKVFFHGGNSVLPLIYFNISSSLSAKSPLLSIPDVIEES